MSIAKETRYERWLTEIAETLAKTGVTAHLFYADRMRGDRMILNASLDIGLVELQVHRKQRGATVILLGETRPAIEHFADRIKKLHRQIPRRQNMRRKFVHRIERMAAQLSTTFDAREVAFPDQALRRVRQRFADAAPMIGVEARFRTGAFEDDAIVFESGVRSGKRIAKRYPTRYAVKLHIGERERAALYSPKRDSFLLVMPQDEPEKQDEEDIGVDILEEAVEIELEKYNEGYDFAVDAPAADGGHWYDCGGLDIPDCDIVDVPDCGGCDCSV